MIDDVHGGVAKIRLWVVGAVMSNCAVGLVGASAMHEFVPTYPGRRCDQSRHASVDTISKSLQAASGKHSPIPSIIQHSPSPSHSI